MSPHQLTLGFDEQQGHRHQDVRVLPTSGVSGP
jgi:hypothetical protein